MWGTILMQPAHSVFVSGLTLALHDGWGSWVYVLTADGACMSHMTLLPCIWQVN